MNYDNVVGFLKAFPEFREMQVITKSLGESRYRSFNLKSKFIMSFPEKTQVGTMVIESISDMYKVHQLECYKNLANELGIVNAQGFYESISYSNCKKGKMGKMNINKTTDKWFSLMMSFIVDNYTQLKYGNKKSPRRNSKQYKDKLCHHASYDSKTRNENPDYKSHFDSTTKMYMSIVNQDRSPTLIPKIRNKCLLSQIESFLTSMSIR